MKSSATSFRNKASNVNIPGTKVSFSNAQLLTSTGSSTLDFFLGNLIISLLCNLSFVFCLTEILFSSFLFLGGGLAIGTVCAIGKIQYNFVLLLIIGCSV